MKSALFVCLQVMCMSENKILRQCFDREELSDKKRPDTVRSVSVCLCLCFLAFLSHSTTNRGVFPSVMVSVWSAGSHSLKNALTLVCPLHTHTYTHTKPQSSTLVPVFWTGLTSLCSCRFSQVTDSVFALSPPSSSSLLLTYISSSPSRRCPSHIFCFCSFRQPHSLKPAWRSSWRSSCPRSRRTSAASSPMTPNKQVRSRFLRRESPTNT